jgi:hypothetical protein
VVADRGDFLMADVSSEALPAVEVALRQLAHAMITRTAGGLHVEASLPDGSPRELNRQVLSALRRIERSTRWRAEWTTAWVTHRFFDYVPKGTRPAAAGPSAQPS